MAIASVVPKWNRHWLYTFPVGPPLLLELALLELLELALLELLELLELVLLELALLEALLEALVDEALLELDPLLEVALALDPLDDAWLLELLLLDAEPLLAAVLLAVLGLPLAAVLVPVAVLPAVVMPPWPPDELVAVELNTALPPCPPVGSPPNPAVPAVAPPAPDDGLVPPPHATVESAPTKIGRIPRTFIAPPNRRRSARP